MEVPCIKEICPKPFETVIIEKTKEVPTYNEIVAPVIHQIPKIYKFFDEFKNIQVPFIEPVGLKDPFVVQQDKPMKIIE